MKGIYSCLYVCAILIFAAANGQEVSSEKKEDNSNAIKLVVETKTPDAPGVHLLKGTATYQGAEFAIAFFMVIQKEYFNSKETYPVIVSMHNVVGEIGGSDGNIKLLDEGFGLLMKADIGADTRHSGEWPAVKFNPRKDAQFIGVLPQTPKDKGFQAMPMSSVVVEITSWVEKNYRVDPDRCYLTGFSYGGSCTWAVAMQFPERFAAIVPLSARLAPAPETAPEKLKDVGVWCGVGENDGDFKASCMKMNDIFVAAKHPNFHFTIVKGGAHHCYQSIYGNPEFWKWLLAQKRKQKK